jgi:hypothetical protein
MKLENQQNYTVRTRVSTGRDVPGQTGTGRPVVPLSRDKEINSKNKLECDINACNSKIA